MNLRRTVSIALAPLLVLAAACGDDEDDGGGDADVASTSLETTGTEATSDTTVATETTGGAETTAAGSDTTAASGETTAASAPGTGADGSAPTGSGSITVGSADFPESQLIAQIYGQALAAAGFDVDYQLAIGSREIYFDAVSSGEVDLVPEYTNSLLSFVLRRDDPRARPEAADVDEQIAALGEALPEGLEVLTPSAAEDKDVIVCTAATAEEFGLTNLSELAAVLDQITLGAPPEFEGRSPFGLAGFEQVLGAPPVGEFVPLDVSGVADALAANQIDCGNLFSTMSVITTEGFVALEDDQTLVPNEAVLPLVRSDVVDEALTAALDDVNAALDTESLKELMVQIEVDAAAPDVVASEWLATLG